MNTGMKCLPIYAGLAFVLSVGSIQGQERGRVVMAAQQQSAKKSGVAFEHVHSLAMDSDGRNLFLGAHTGLYRSSDHGRIWNRVSVSSKYAHLDVMDIAADPKDPNAIYIGTHEAGVLKTTDRGKTWSDTSSGLGGADVHGLALDPNMPSKLHAAVRDKGQGIYRTTDQGRRWIRVDDGPQGEIKVLRSVNLPTGMGGIFLYAGTSTGLQRSADCF